MISAEVADNYIRTQMGMGTEHTARKLDLEHRPYLTTEPAVIIVASQEEPLMVSRRYLYLTLNPQLALPTEIPV